MVIFNSEREEIDSEQIAQVFEEFRGANIKLIAEKRFLLKRVKYLGYIISLERVFSDPQKIETIKTLLMPTNATKVRAYTGPKLVEKISTKCRRNISNVG